MAYEKKFSVPLNSDADNDLHRVLTVNGGKFRAISYSNSDKDSVGQLFNNLFEFDEGIVVLSSGTDVDPWQTRDMFIGIYPKSFIDTQKGRTVSRAIDTVIGKYALPDSVQDVQTGIHQYGLRVHAIPR